MVADATNVRVCRATAARRSKLVTAAVNADRAGCMWPTALAAATTTATGMTVAVYPNESNDSEQQ